jgi:hypothetical protein
MQALYSDQFRDLHDGYGLKYETAAEHPHLFIPFAPWRGAREHFALMEAMSSTVPIAVLLRDRDGGEVRVGRDGEPVVRYKLSEFDSGHMRTGIDGAAQMLEAAGARRVFSSHAKWVGYDPSTGSRAQFMADADAAGYGAGQCVLNRSTSWARLGWAGRPPPPHAIRPDRPGRSGGFTCSTARAFRPLRRSTRRSRSRRSRTWAPGA